MLSGLFQSTSIPVLEQMVDFAQARHTILAGNIANLDTPGYQARDLSVQEFQNRLKEAIATKSQPQTRSPGEPSQAGGAKLGEVAKASQPILRHDLGNVNMESQVSEMVQNQMQHNLAISILSQQFRLLQAAISERVT